MWWQDGVIYQIYIRSFFDSNGDGVGDIAGVIAKLDYLEELGIAAIWLSPVGPSANRDWGYDVTDYCVVEPSLGTSHDLEELIAEAKERGIQVLLDLVPNHTSIDHPWFVAARSSRDDPKRDWYLWADPKPGGQAPNNWRSSFGGSAWKLDKTTSQYYLHNFLPQQADLNWTNPEVQKEFKHILRYWFDRGVAGFRIDVVNMLIKDPALRDNPHALPSDARDVRLLGQQPVYSGNGEGVHSILRGWRELAEGYRQPRLLLGETMVYTAKHLAMFYGYNDELQLGFDFPFWQAPFRASALRQIVASVEAALPEGAWPAWAASNHDIPRAASRWAHGNEAKLRLALMLILTLRGTPVLYYGEELGMSNTFVPRWRYRDEAGKRFWPLFAGRDRERTPMVWEATKTAGFTNNGVRPWLPIGSRRRNVADQRMQADSTFTITRRLMALRQSSEDLRRGGYQDLSTTNGVWAYQRGKSTMVILNMSSRAVNVSSPPARQRFSTRGPLAHLGGTNHKSWQLAAWEGIILTLVDKA